MVQIEEVEETAPTQRGCAYCSEAASSKVCSLCRDVAYCSKGCQQAHWRVHRKECTRKHAPLPKDPPRIENPCVRCGKQGILKSSGSWYCSHDCCSSNVDDLTSQIRQLNSQRRDDHEARRSLDAKEAMDCCSGGVDGLASQIRQLNGLRREDHEARRSLEAKESHAAKEFARIKDFIASSCSAPAPSVKPAEESRPQVRDPNEHIRRLIESQNRKAGGACEPAPRAEDEATQRAGAEEGRKPSTPAPEPQQEHGARKAKEPTHPVLQKMQEHQEALKNLEKAKQDHQRFTEWVQWAQGEIQRKQRDESDDGV